MNVYLSGRIREGRVLNRMQRITLRFLNMERMRNIMPNGSRLQKQHSREQ